MPIKTKPSVPSAIREMSGNCCHFSVLAEAANLIALIIVLVVPKGPRDEVLSREAAVGSFFILGR